MASQRLACTDLRGVSDPNHNGRARINRRGHPQPPTKIIRSAFGDGPSSSALAAPAPNDRGPDERDGALAQSLVRASSLDRDYSSGKELGPSPHLGNGSALAHLSPITQQRRRLHSVGGGSSHFRTQVPFHRNGRKMAYARRASRKTRMTDRCEGRRNCGLSAVGNTHRPRLRRR